MKSVQFAQVGLPQEVLEVKEIAKPTPKEGEVCIKVTACNINPSDVMFIQGMYGITPVLPAVGGFEAAGVIDSCGEGVSLPVGMRVVFTAIGVWQEYVVVSAKTILPTPEGMSDEVACQAFVNPYTAYGMLEEAGLKEGDWLMLTAGGSAFANFVIQLCKQRGIRTICTVRRDTQVQQLLETGATAVINTETESLSKSVKKLTEGKGVNVVFDAVGGVLGAKAVECLGMNGKALVLGLLSLEATPINYGSVIFRNLTIKGFWLTTWMASLDREQKKSIGKAVFGMLASEQLKAVIEATYPISEVKVAVAHAERPGRYGKILLKMA